MGGLMYDGTPAGEYKSLNIRVPVELGNRIPPFTNINQTLNNIIAWWLCGPPGRIKKFLVKEKPKKPNTIIHQRKK